jgi:hypothetical protein
LQAKEQEISEIHTEVEARQAAKSAAATAGAAGAATVEDVVEDAEDVSVAHDPLDDQDEIKADE